MTDGGVSFDDVEWRLVHVVHYDPEGLDDLSSMVARAIAAAKGIDPTELHPPLSRVVNLEAIDDLFAGSYGQLRVDFRYASYRVTVRSDDRIRIYEPVRSDESDPE